MNFTAVAGLFVLHDRPAFAEVLNAHMTARTGERPHVPYDEAFPASAQLRGTGEGKLNVYDDGEDFSIMVVAEGTKAGTGTGVTVADVESFTAALAAVISSRRD